MKWGDFERAAPEIARLGRERLEGAALALLGTLRRDGSPRISPVEPGFAQDELLFAAMRWSMKARDLARDPRCVLHSAATDPEGSEGELKLYGRAVEVLDQVLRRLPAEAWWATRPAREAYVCSLSVEQAVFVAWDVDRGEVTLMRWSEEHGTDEVTRPYP